ncbi:MAG TPA: FtsH protease activity modulator HflK [Vicinamibacterales bacterium]|nr:FtsH protease activity modulator HflK [Vicinamibacterales bacterium]
MLADVGEPVRVQQPWLRRVLDVRVVVPALLLVYALSGVYAVSADQQAVVVRLGKVQESRVPSGVHWTWPAPIARVYKLRVRETRRLMLGLEATEPVNRSQFLTGDRNVLNIRVVVQFAISDPAAFLFRTADVNTLVSNATLGALAQVVAGRGVDDLLTTEKVAVQERVQALAEATVSRYDCGVSVLSVVLDAIVPPDDVVDAFRLVAAARADSDRIVREAESYANGVVPVARGQAAKTGQEALAYNAQTVDGAAGDAARFSGLAQEYAKAPRETATRLYLETMEEVLPKMDKTVVGADPKSVDLQFVGKK